MNAASHLRLEYPYIKLTSRDPSASIRKRRDVDAPRTTTTQERKALAVKVADRRHSQGIIANSPYYRPGADGGDDDASLNGRVPRDRWPGLRTRDEMRTEVNKKRSDNLKEA